MTGQAKLFSAGLIVAAATLLPRPAQADGTDCVVYATDYANSYVGNGDMIGDVVSGGIAGAVAGREWDPVNGETRGARVGGAVAVLNNLGSLPGGWQGLYDMAYQMCLQQTSGANADPYSPEGGYGVPEPRCRSSASVNKPLHRTPEGGLMASSGSRSCR